MLVFPCSKCGICCKNIDKVPELKPYDLGNGTCKYLDLNTNLCTIYDTRPDICRVDKMYEIHFKNIYSKEEFYELNLKSCEYLQGKENSK